MKKDKVNTSYMLSEDAIATLEGSTLGLNDSVYWKLMKVSLELYLAEGGALQDLDAGQGEKRKKSFQVLRHHAGWLKKEAKKRSVSASSLMNSMLIILKKEDERKRVELIPEAKKAREIVMRWKEELKGMNISRFEDFGAAFGKDLEREALFVFDTILESFEECIGKGESK